MRFKTRLIVNLKPTVKDCKVGTLCKILQRNDFERNPKISVGSYYELEVTAEEEFEALDKIKAICENVLTNPVIEEYTIISIEKV